MKFVIIIGPQAVGKMTVGENLAERTGMKLFHNHMTIDLLLKIFKWNDMKSLNALFREEIFKSFSKLDSEQGLIFTYVMDFDNPKEWEYVEHITSIFDNAEIYYIELVANLETRLERNKTPNRLQKKWTKKNIAENEERMKETMKYHRTTSSEDEVTFDNYLRIDNTNLSAEETTKEIMEQFKL